MDCNSWSINYFVNCKIYIDFTIPVTECLIVILLSVLINIFFFQKDNPISDEKVFFFLLFDTTQLGVLLFLTGGILNPFIYTNLSP